MSFNHDLYMEAAKYGYGTEDIAEGLITWDELKDLDYEQYLRELEEAEAPICDYRKKKKKKFTDLSCLNKKKLPSDFPW